MQFNRDWIKNDKVYVVIVASGVYRLCFRNKKPQFPRSNEKIYPLVCPKLLRIIQLKPVYVNDYSITNEHRQFDGFNRIEFMIFQAKVYSKRTSYNWKVMYVYI